MSLKKFFQCAKGIFIQNQHYLNKFLLCSFSLDKKMNQKDQGCTQFVKTITPFTKRKKLIPKPGTSISFSFLTENGYCFFTQIVLGQNKPPAKKSRKLMIIIIADLLGSVTNFNIITSFSKRFRQYWAKGSSHNQYIKCTI